MSRRGLPGYPIYLMLAIGILLASVLLSACAPAASQVAAQQKTALDQQLQLAISTFDVPPSLLAPLEAREQQTAHAVTGSDQSQQQAATVYSQLDTQVVALERTSPTQARAWAQADLDRFTAAYQAVQSQGFIEALTYQQTLVQATQQFHAATTTKDYFQVDKYIQAQTAAVNSLNPTFQVLTTLQSLVQAQSQTSNATGTQSPYLQCAQGTNNTYWYTDTTVKVQTAPSTAAPTLSTDTQYSQWLTQDVTLLRGARSTQDYTALQSLMAAQRSQILANSATEMPLEATQVLQTYTTDVHNYQQYGGTDTRYQQQATADQQSLTAAKTASDFNTLMQSLNQQEQAIQLPLLMEKTQHDMAALKQLVAQAQSLFQTDPANGQKYPDAYEYADPHTGIGDAQARLANATTLTDYQNVEREITMFSTNLQAMLTNLNDSTPATQVHATDLNLLQYYGVTPDKVVVVSLREQAARMYQDGKLVKSFQVTTGAPDLPSIAGIHCVMDQEQNTVFTSPDPVGSPNYYQPTPIHFAMMYSYYGYFLHDAWWRTEFGKYTNLPHYDPAAFNGGSHGCINIALPNAQWLYSWVSVGTPVIVY